MLIRYTFKNWLSFREEATFSMVASKELQHNDRLARVNKFDLRLLPTPAHGKPVRGGVGVEGDCGLPFARDLHDL